MPVRLEIEGQRLEFEVMPSPEVIDNVAREVRGLTYAGKSVPPLVPKEWVTRTETTKAPEGEGFVSRVQHYARAAIPDTRTGVGMVGGALGAAGAGPAGAALGYPLATKAYDVSRDIYHGLVGQPLDPESPEGELARTTEDIAVGVGGEMLPMAGGEVAGWMRGALPHVPGGRQIVERMQAARQSRALLEAGQRAATPQARVAAGEAAQAKIGEKYVSEAAAKGTPFDQVVRTAGDQPIKLTETGQLLAEQVEERQNLRPTGQRLLQQALPDDPRRRSGVVLKILRATHPGMDIDQAAEIAHRLWEHKVSPQMLQELADAKAQDVIELLVGDGEVTLAEAMGAEQQAHHLGGKAFRGSPNQRFYRRLAGSLRRDYKHWLGTSGLQVGGKPADQAFEQAAGEWAELQQTTGKAKTELLGKGRLRETGAPLRPEEAKSPEAAIRVTFDPKNPSRLLNLQRAIPYPEYKQMVEAWLGELYQGAHEQVRPGLQRYSQRKFTQDLSQHVESGFLEQVLQPLVDHGDLSDHAVESLVRTARPGLVTRAGEAMEFSRLPALGTGTLAALLGIGGPEFLAHHGGITRQMSPMQLLTLALASGGASAIQRPAGHLLAELGRSQPLQSETLQRALAEFAAQRGIQGAP